MDITQLRKDFDAAMEANGWYWYDDIEAWQHIDIFATYSPDGMWTLRGDVMPWLKDWKYFALAGKTPQPR